LLTARSDRLKKIKKALDGTVQDRAVISNVVSQVNTLANAISDKQSGLTELAFEEILALLGDLSKDLSTIVDAIESAQILPATKLSDIPDILSAAERCRTLASRVESNDQVKEILGGFFAGPATDLGPVKATLQVADTITSGIVPQRAVEWLMCPDYRSHLAQLSRWLTDADRCGKDWKLATAKMSQLSGSNLWNEVFSDSFDPARALVQRCLVARQELSGWSHFLRLRLESKAAGLQKLTVLSDAGRLPADALVSAYRFCFFNTLARSAFSEHADLSKIAGVTQEQVREQFVRSDKEVIRLYGERVAAQIDRRAVPGGNQSGPVRSWTDMALLNNEMNKQKRHIPIRQLILRSANALVALKPCFMMGPLSVAQYLAPGQVKFDLIIMDEASQLKPEDAIGALARGGQAVIVGDPKQLPPTSFFQRVSAETEDDDDSVTAVEEGESILDVASTLFQPVRRLRWHYRSRHHSLIAFSNKEFYGDLIIFPSAYHEDPQLGVKHHFVTDGVFENSRNPREAEIVVDAVIEHMKYHPDESLGVVTLNFEQRELIEDLLDRKLREDPAAIAYQERMTGGQESFFVKNLENVQGDERDVMFISTTYGPDSRRNQFQRFGPI
jgi:hypothetical protein